MSNQIKVLHFSSHYEDCGIAKYQEQYLDGMKAGDEVYNEFFSYSPYQTRVMFRDQFDQVLNELAKQLQDFDILHIQHEFGFFSTDEFARLVSTAKELGKKVVVTVHTAPYFADKPVKLSGLGPRSFILYLRQLRALKKFRARHIEPFMQSDMLLVHNAATKESLLRMGVSEGIVITLEHPVPAITKSDPSEYIAKNLNKKSGDIIYCTVGFLHKHKGLFAAVKALKYLPDNYKLAVLGGLHPITDDIAIYDKLTDLIDTLNLKDRVFITGYIKEDSKLNSYIRECDVCVYPYDKQYYDNVSSGSLNLAFANERPVIAYPTRTFKEMNSEIGQINLCGTFAYYELAREIKNMNYESQIKKISVYANKYSWAKMSTRLSELYKQIVS